MSVLERIRRFAVRLSRVVRRAFRDPKAFLFRLAVKHNMDTFARLLTRAPRTFNEKLRFKMLRDRNPLLVCFADKLASKQYIREHVGADYVPRTLRVVSAGTELMPRDISERCVIKVTHASGGVILVSPDASAHARIPTPQPGFGRLHVRQSNIDHTRLQRILDHWLSQEYGKNKGEWAYEGVTRRILVEEFLQDDDGKPASDLKFFVMHGTCRLIRWDHKVADNKTLNHYLPTGEPVDVSFREHAGPTFSSVRPPPALPPHWSQMVAVAEKLGNNTDFVRVDMFVLGDKFKIGELTNYPTSGTGQYNPRSFDLWLGSFWDLSQGTSAR